MTLFITSTMVSLMFMFTKVPLMMTMLIIAQTTLVSLSIYTFMTTSWLAFILFMILVSAMMVIFTYVSSLASNDFLATPYSVMTPILYLGPLLVLATYYGSPTQQTSVSPSPGLSDMDLGPMACYKLYTPNVSLLTVFLITYLLITLIVAAKISTSSKGPLRARAN